MPAIHSMQLQKEVKSNPKQPSSKKSVWPQEGHCEKGVKSEMAAKKWLNSRLMERILAMTIQVNLVPNPSKT